MDTQMLVESLEHTAARLLVAAEHDNGDSAQDMRRLAAQLQAMTDRLDEPGMA